MAKGQKRSNREIKKPKQKKETPVAPASFEKAVNINKEPARKKP